MVKTSDDYEKPKAIRIPTDDEWVPFGDATKAMHPEGGRSPRTAVIREFMRWYMRRPGAMLPKRPDAGPWSVLAAVEHSPPAGEPKSSGEPVEVEPEPDVAVAADESATPILIVDLSRRALEALALHAYREGDPEQQALLVAVRKNAAQGKFTAAACNRAVIEAAMAFTQPLLTQADLAVAVEEYPAKPLPAE